MQLLHARVGKLRFQKRIYLLTDAAAPIINDPPAMEMIEEGMRRDEFKLNIIGMGFTEEDDDDDDDDEDGVKKKEEKEEHKESDAPAAASSSSSVKKESLRTSTQRFNEVLLKRFARHVEGSVFNATSAISVLSEFRSRSVNQVTKFRGTLEIGGTHINVWTYSKTAAMNMPTMKKQSVLAPAASSVMGEDESAAAAAGGGWGGGGGGWGGDDDDGDGGGGGGFGADTDSRIQMERTYLNKRGEREREVKPEMRIKSFRYGKEQVPFSEEDIEQLKYKSDKGIRVLSFVPQKIVPRQHYMAMVDWSDHTDNSSCARRSRSARLAHQPHTLFFLFSSSVVAEPGDYSSALALSALIHACYDTAKVAVVRYVKRMNDRPLLGILIPVVKADMEVFYFNQLPFEEDIREFPFSGLEDVKVTPNQKQAAIDLVRSMNLMTAQKDEDGDAGEALIPKYTFNPILQRFYQCVERRALDDQADISELDPSIARYIVPDASLMRVAAPKLINFKQAFDLRPVEKQEKKKRHWRSWYSSEVKDSDIEDVRKKMRQQGHGEEGAAAGIAGIGISGGGGGGGSPFDSRAPSTFSLDAALAPTVDKVGAVNPIADFQTLLQRRDDPSVIKRAIDEMAQRIHESVNMSYRGSWYDKVSHETKTGARAHAPSNCVPHHRAATTQSPPLSFSHSFSVLPCTFFLPCPGRRLSPCSALWLRHDGGVVEVQLPPRRPAARARSNPVEAEAESRRLLREDGGSARDAHSRRRGRRLHTHRGGGGEVLRAAARDAAAAARGTRSARRQRPIRLHGVKTSARGRPPSHPIEMFHPM